MDLESAQSDNVETARRIGLLLPVTGLMVALILAVFAVAWLAAEAQNRQAIAAMQHTLRSVVAANHRELGGWASDHAYWDTFVESVVVEPDPVWIDDNIGTYAHEDLDIDVTLVVDGDMEVYVESRADGLDIDTAMPPISADLKALVLGSREIVGPLDERPGTFLAYLRISGRIFMAAASTAKWENDEVLPERNGGPVVLVFLREVDEEMLAGFGDDYMIKGLALLDDVAERPDALALTAPDGRTIAQLTWQTAHPGSAFLRDLAIPLVVVLLIAGCLVALIIARVRGAVRQLVMAHKTLNQRTEALRAARDEADRANRAKTEFLAQMSHDLRTPLNAILGFSEVIALQTFGSDTAAGSRYRDYARQIHSGGDHLRSLIDSILDVARLDAGRYELHTEPVALDDLVGKCLAMLRGQIDGKAFTVHAPPSGLTLRVDRGAIEQVLLNLVGNATKYTDAGGRISVAAVQRNGAVEVSVSDTGAGMSPEDLDSAFDLFSRGESVLGLTTEGTGIGLSIVKRLVELHGGSVSIDSTLGEGTTVTVTLPVEHAGTMEKSTAFA